MVVFQLDKVFEHIDSTVLINLFAFNYAKLFDATYLHEPSPVIFTMKSQSLLLGSKAAPALRVEHPPSVPARG
jgi:hypothetical protein